MRGLMWKYHDLPMDLADATLVRVVERERIRRVFTADRRDFEIYGLSGSSAPHPALIAGSAAYPVPSD